MDQLPTNGGMLYHEVQESKLCAVHCVNTVLQGPFFSEFDLASLAADLDSKERQVMTPDPVIVSGDYDPDHSHNASLVGDFSIQVIERALEIWDLQVIPLYSPTAEAAHIDPEKENAFICHLQNHWFCIRKANGEWYNFNSLYAAPEHLSKFSLAAHLDTLKGYGWSIFLVRGNFPAECPLSSSEASNRYGQWLSPEDADIIFKTCNQTGLPPSSNNPTAEPLDHNGMTSSLAVEKLEDEELNAAIEASLVNFSAVARTGEGSPTKSDNGEK